VVERPGVFRHVGFFLLAEVSARGKRSQMWLKRTDDAFAPARQTGPIQSALGCGPARAIMIAGQPV